MLSRPAFERPSPAQVERLRSALDRALGDSKVLHEPGSLASYADDESEQEPVLPDAVVLAESSADIVATLGVANALGIPVTPRAGGSGKSGGCVPVAGGIVLSMMGMGQLLEIDREEQLAVVQPGLILGDLHHAVEKEGLFYPPDPNSFKMCALGGNIAENAAGPRAFKYGVTRDYVLGLEVVTAEGTPLKLGRRTRKGVTGYDMTGLMVGSEGTLAITTQATLRLIRKPQQIVTLMVLFPDVQRSAEAVSAVVAQGLSPRCLELVDEASLQAMRDHGVGVDPSAGAMLLIELDGEPSDCDRAMERVGDCVTAAGALEVLVAQDPARRERLWQTRRELSYITRRMARHKISEDVVVPRRDVARLVNEVMRISERRGVRMLNYGHAGDGNLHVNILWDHEQDAPKVEAALDDLFRAVLAMGGTLTGEHGVGVSKAEYLPLEQSADLIAMQRRIKAQFDPKGILNPGKIFPRRGHGSC